MQYILIVMIWLALSAAPPALGGPLEDAIAAEKRGEFQKAVRLMRPLAQNGNAEAQYFLGEMYDKGLGVERNAHGNGQNWGKAAEWFEKAALQGHAFAQHNLGVYHFYGWGVAKDRSIALKWLELAASTTEKRGGDPTKSKDLIAEISKEISVELSQSKNADTACILAAAEKLPKIPGLEIKGSSLSGKQFQRTGGGLPGWTMLVALEVKAAGQDVTYAMACAHVPGQQTSIFPVR